MRLVRAVWLLVLAAPLITMAPAQGNEPLPLSTFEIFETPPTDGWPRWGQPLGPAAAAVQLSTDGVDGRRAGLLTYAGARGHVMIPAPGRNLVGRPTVLRLWVRGDGSGNQLGINLIDAGGEWFSIEPIAVDWQGWRPLRLDLMRFATHGLGDADGRPDPPLSLLSLNVGFDARPDGQLAFDDLQLEQVLIPAIDYLDVALADRSGLRTFLPEESQPTLRVLNRAGSSLPLEVEWQAGPSVGRAEVLPAPGREVELPLPVDGHGPQELAVRLRVGDEERTESFPFALLPPRSAARDGFTGLGLHDTTLPPDHSFLPSLPLLRAVGAGWTGLSFPGALGADWRPASPTWLLVRSQGLQVVPSLALPDEPAAAAALGRELGDLERRLEEALLAWWLRPPAGNAAGVELRPLLARLRPLLTAPQVGAPLVGAGPTLPWDGVIVAPQAAAPPLDPGAPRAWQALAHVSGDGRPVWLWADAWPWQALTGLDDPAAAVAVAWTCARAVPGVVAAGAGRLPIASGSSPELAPAFLAMATNTRLLGGLACAGLSSPAPGLFTAWFEGDQHEVRVVWSEGAPADWKADADEAVYDVSGRPLLRRTLTVAGAPLYLVRQRSAAPASP